MGKSAPSAPNPYQVAGAQTQENTAAAQEQQKLNEINQYGPLGSSVYSQGPNGTTSNTVSLSPNEQAILNQQQGNQLQSGRLASQLLTQFDKNPIQYQVENPSQFQGQANQLTNSVLQRLAPSMAQQSETLNSTLANQGLTPGTQAYQQAQLTNSQGQNDLRLGAVQTGDQEQQQLYNENLQGAQFANQAQAQGLGEIGQLMQGGAYQAPQFQQTPQVQIQPANLSSDVYNSYDQQMQNYEAQQQGLFGLGGTLLGAGLNYGLTGGAGGIFGSLFGGGSDAFSGAGTSAW